MPNIKATGKARWITDPLYVSVLSAVA